jgi:predicted TIM-barrel fold metal-dependent hydrolase
MIVDVHTNLPSHLDAVPESDQRVEYGQMSGSGGFSHVTNSMDDLLKAIAPVDRAICFGIARPPSDPDFMPQQGQGWPESMNLNDIAAEVARRAPDGKIVPFMALHPLDPNVNEEYDRAVGDLGLKGLKIAAGGQRIDPESDEAFRLFARLEQDGLPVLIHGGTTGMWNAPLMYGHPLVFDRVAMAFPRLKIVMAHLGHPWHTDCLAVVRKHVNVWADVSGQFYRPWSFWNGMRLFHEWGVTQKILFGSDWPLTDPQDNIDGLRNLNKYAADHYLPGIPEEEIEGIVNRDTLGLLGLG